MGPAASEFNQQDHTELHKKTTSLCERWDGRLERALRKMFNDVKHWTLQVTVNFFSVIVKYGIKCCESCNSWSDENILVKFSSIIENSFRCKSQKSGKKSVSCRETAFCPVGHFLIHPVHNTRFSWVRREWAWVSFTYNVFFYFWTVQRHDPVVQRRKEQEVLSSQ